MRDLTPLSPDFWVPDFVLTTLTGYCCHPCAVTKLVEEHSGGSSDNGHQAAVIGGLGIVENYPKLVCTSSLVVHVISFAYSPRDREILFMFFGTKVHGYIVIANYLGFHRMTLF